MHKPTRNARLTDSFVHSWPSYALLRRKESAGDDLMAQIRKGTTVWIVLATLEQRSELYGYGLRREVWVNSKGLFPLTEGALYPSLKLMERRRWVTSRYKEVGGRDRRYYRISARGRQMLDQYRRDWQLLSSVLDALGCRHA